MHKMTKLIIEDNTEGSILQAVSDTMPEYVDSDWEDEFDDIEEAYEEQGRGEAESSVLWSLVDRYEVPEGDRLQVFEELVEHYELNVE